MRKLIDADKLKAHYAWWNDENKEIFDSIIDQMPDEVQRHTFEMKVSMDIDEIIEGMKDKGWKLEKHGRWQITDADPDDAGNFWYVCTQCNHGDRHAPEVYVPYCWYCGARMDGDSE